MKHLARCLLLLCTLTSCSSYKCDYTIVGPDEFVIDSYQIREGKTAILEMMGECLEELPPDALEEYRDEIAEDDVLNIAIYHPTRKDLVEIVEMVNKTLGGFHVVNGEVSFPEVPPIHVAGLTLEEARQKVQEHFLDHYDEVQVFLFYKARLRKRVELSGQVAASSIPVDGKIRLYETLATAKVNPGANLFMSYVMRNGKQLPIDLHKLMNEGDMCQNIVMRGGDKIFIANPADSPVMVMGEVNIPTAVPVPYGYIPLPEALVAARGIPYTGDRRHIQIIRGDLQYPKIYSISWEHIVHLPNNSMLLIPGDTVYVSEKPITQWNRFISQLMPSLAGAQAAHATYSIMY